MPRLARLILRRLAASLPVLALILVVLFLVLRLAPGDAVDALLSQMGSGDGAIESMLRSYYGVQGSTSAQLLAYLARLARLDLGVSVQYAQPVLDVILTRLPVTVLLMTSALALSLVVGSVVGVLAARRAGRWQDSLITIVGLVFYATPSFWFGLMGLLLFSVKLAWLPSGGLSDLAAGLTGWRWALDVAEHLILPTVTLALIYMAVYLRVMRASMLEVLTLDFVRTARAKGAAEKVVLIRHVLRNALLPLVTILGLQAGSMLGGAVVVESVFSLPGLGRLALDAVTARDLNMLLGIVLMSAVLVVLINLAVDLLYARLDPRIESFD